MPHGGTANFLPAGILSEMVTGVLDAAIAGTLHHKQRHLIPQCQLINKALTITGEVALIDEATGYQYHREPDALQDLFSKLIRQSCATWERRFHPDYYQSLFRLFGWEYTGQPRKPSIIGAITLKWVYEIAFPPEILTEVKERQQSAKMHQWLTEEGGLPILEKQRDAVMMIADSSADPADFESRCMKVFNRQGQLGLVFPSHDEAA